MNKRTCATTTERLNDTYTGKWFLPFRLVFILSVILLIAACAVQFPHAKDDGSVKLYLDINFTSNLIMNKYDVLLELDGEQLDTLEYGLYYTNLCKVSPGEHKIRFCKADDSDVMGEMTILVEENTTFQCQLKTKRKEIGVEDDTTFKGTAGHSIEMPDCVGLHLVDARELLKQKGFVNYRYESETEKKVRERTWAVDVQNIKAGEKTDKNNEIILTCVPAEVYIEKTFTGLTYSEAIKKAEAIGYQHIRMIDTRQKGDEQAELKAADISEESKQYWTVKSAEDNYSHDATLVLNFAYSVPMPDLSGVKAEKADSEMSSIQQGHFDYDFVGYKTGDFISYGDLKKYKIIEQSIEPGAIIKYKSSITFKCKKTKAAKEAEKKARAAAKAKAEREAQEELESKLNTKVWYTNTGKCYHTHSCSHLRSEIGPITQREAIKLGKKPCDDCIEGGLYYIPNWKDYR